MAALPALVGSLPDPPLPHLLRQEPRRRGRQRWAELRGQGGYFYDVSFAITVIMKVYSRDSSETLQGGAGGRWLT